MQSVRVKRATEDDVPVFPLYDLYWNLVTNRGGTPIPQSNTRYWLKPVYPPYDSGNPDHYLYTSIAALNTGIGVRSAGDYLFLQDGDYSGEATDIIINTAGLWVGSQTKHGAVLSSGIEIQANNVDVFGFKIVATNGTLTSAILINTANITDAVIAYNLLDPTTGTSINSDYIKIDDPGDHRNRICYNTISGGTPASQGISIDSGGGDGQSAAGQDSVGCQYCRVDHNFIDGFVGTAANSSEVIIYGQNQADVDYFGLVDNNWMKDCNDDDTEGEYLGFKCSRNFIIQNVFENVEGRCNHRQGESNVYYANYFFGGLGSGGLGECHGITATGKNDLVACNYFADMNQVNDSAKVGGWDFGGGEVDDPNNITGGEYVAADGMEASFNTCVNGNRPVMWDQTGGGLTRMKPDNTKLYNCAVENPLAATDTAFDSNRHGESYDDGWGTTPTFKGNVVDTPGTPTTAVWDGTNTNAAPALTTTNGYKVPTAAGNCDGTGEAGYSSEITVDILGNPIPATNPDVGCFQTAATGYTLDFDPAQFIRDRAGTGV